MFGSLIAKLPNSVASKTGSWRDGYSSQITDENEFTSFIGLDTRFNY